MSSGADSGLTRSVTDEPQTTVESLPDWTRRTAQRGYTEAAERAPMPRRSRTRGRWRCPVTIVIVIGLPIATDAVVDG